jgi:ribosomal protein L14
MIVVMITRMERRSLGKGIGRGGQVQHQLLQLIIIIIITKRGIAWQQHMEMGDTSMMSAKRRKRIESMEQRQEVPHAMITMTRRCRRRRDGGVVKWNRGEGGQAPPAATVIIIIIMGKRRRIFQRQPQLHEHPPIYSPSVLHHLSLLQIRGITIITTDIDESTMFPRQ